MLAELVTCQAMSATTPFQATSKLEPSIFAANLSGLSHNPLKNGRRQ